MKKKKGKQNKMSREEIELEKQKDQIIKEQEQLQKEQSEEIFSIPISPPQQSEREWVEYLESLEKTEEHFVCAKCKQSVGKKYVVKDGHILHEKCLDFSGHLITMKLHEHDVLWMLNIINYNKKHPLYTKLMLSLTEKREYFQCKTCDRVLHRSFMYENQMLNLVMKFLWCIQNKNKRSCNACSKILTFCSEACSEKYLEKIMNMLKRIDVDIEYIKDFFEEEEKRRDKR